MDAMTEINLTNADFSLICCQSCPQAMISALQIFL